MGKKSHYVCAPLSTDCIAALIVVQEALFSDAKKLGLRKSGVENAHFTLGVYSISKERTQKESEEEIVGSVNERLKDFLDKQAAMQLVFGDIGSFGSQYVYVNVMNVEELKALRKDMNKMLEEEGIYLADNRFTPHVTLFKSRGGWGGGGVDRLTDMLKRNELPPVSPSVVTKITFRRLQQ